VDATWAARPRRLQADAGCPDVNQCTATILSSKLNTSHVRLTVM